MPKRIKRQRTKGWTMPENAVYVGRPTHWGNPVMEVDNRYGDKTDLLVQLFEGWARRMIREYPHWLDPLVGKDIACWCDLDRPCHGDVLLRLANPSADEDYLEDDSPILHFCVACGAPFHGNPFRVTCRACA